MKLSYCCLYSPHSLFPFLLAGCVLLRVALTVTVTAATLNDVPSCACQADTTCGTEGSYPVQVGACNFVAGFGNVRNASIPICDGLEADSEFQETIGDEANTYSSTLNGATTALGPYYISGPLTYRVDYGTCDDLYNAQPQKSWCPTSDFQNITDDEYASELDGALGPYYISGPLTYRVDYGTCDDLYNAQPQKSWCPTSDFQNITDDEYASELDGNFEIGLFGFSHPKPGSSGSVGSYVKNITSVLQVHYLCESSSSSSRASAITAGYEDNLFLIVSIGPEVNPNDDYEWLPEVDMSRPTLTNQDWIKPIAGSSRRYMTHDIVDVENAREYCILFTAIGNEHCSGPPPPPTSMPVPLPNPPSSSTNGNFRHASILLISSIIGTFVFIVFM
eukprot:CAMPEP_0194446482 /NCGR_PEP_ID=MMETSP0176-20130528/128466_1 /TAXON_ID=216777 /ORGANISM="Proboscia alata, Strain PI-D3" /LENGTH=390 /DNA_ID=CAMNT_0039273207 /DNA_START=164 /DNA_END=1336 /DNA_ORIENTATION=-